MKLQIALDELSLDESLDLIGEVREYVDIVEIGTPFLIKDGLETVRKMRQRYPELEILADTKIMDGGYYEAELAYKAGADYCTVLGVTDDLTIKACLDAAKKYKKSVFVDMICVKDVVKRVEEIERLGVDSIAVHTGVDLQASGFTPLDDLKRIRKASKKSRLSVAGGINYESVVEYMKEGAEIIIVGGGIAHSDAPAEVAKKLYEKIHGDKK